MGNAMIADSASTSVALGLPPLPRLVLRIGFAGNRLLPEDASRLNETLLSLMEVVCRRMTEIANGTALHEVDRPRVAKFFSLEKPLLRLVTGLCEGADDLALRALDQINAASGLATRVETESAAVIPFDLATYRKSRPPEFSTRFDELVSRCTYVLELDGKYDRPTEETPLSRMRRERAYRSQSTLLLRQSDIVIVSADSKSQGKAGGALETMRSALEFELPVVFVHISSGDVWLIEPGSDLAATISGPCLSEADWQRALGDWISRIVADPDATPATSPHQNHVEGPGQQGEALLEEFFLVGAFEKSLPGSTASSGRQSTFGERCWRFFEQRFRASDVLSVTDPPLEPYATARSRATNLNYHYSGRYRGAFVLNYALAVVAVLLAALSLVILGKAHCDDVEQLTLALTASENLGQSRPNGDAALIGTNSGVDHSARELSGTVLGALIALGMTKLAIVVWIVCNTHWANHGDWNDKAVDYRYLAERLRAMYYLPRIGSFQPPAAAPPQYASRVVRQSAVDWLFDAIVRSISPADMPQTKREVFSFGDGATVEASILRLDKQSLLSDVRDRWVAGQSSYHAYVADTMWRMNTFLERTGGWLSKAVIAFVAIDVVIVLAERFHWLPPIWLESLSPATPWLVFMAAVLPAAVASLNGIRFQSESRRLAERSLVMRSILCGADPSVHGNGGRWGEVDVVKRKIELLVADPDGDLGSWTSESLRITEKIARDFAQEVAEWSVLYAKEVPEP